MATLNQPKPRSESSEQDDYILQPSHHVYTLPALNTRVEARFVARPEKALGFETSFR